MEELNFLSKAHVCEWHDTNLIPAESKGIRCNDNKMVNKVDFDGRNYFFRKPEDPGTNSVCPTKDICD